VYHPRPQESYQFINGDTYLGPLSVEHWINDGLMPVFFLPIALELEREFHVSELSSFRNALLPILAALGGVCLSALIHYGLNSGTPSRSGVGIPMATERRAAPRSVWPPGVPASPCWSPPR
jgi:NhaA family Na+:H+ antiporter